MPPRLPLSTAFRSLSLRPKPSSQCLRLGIAARQCRGYADNTTPQDPAASSQIPGDGHNLPPPDLPVGSINRSDSAVQASPGLGLSTETANLDALSQLELVSYGLNPFDPKFTGHKYGLPTLPLPPEMNLKKRYDPIIEQLTRLLMRDGKLSKAQRDFAMVLNYLRTSSPPKYNPRRPLMPGAPPASHLPLDPVRYLTLAIDSVAPLIRIRRLAKLAGGGRALELPVPIAQRSRRRQAFVWIMEVVAKKPNKGSGRTMLAHRIGEEIVAVVEGRSSVWQKRDLLHRMGTTQRANVNSPKLSRMRRR